MCGNLLVMSNMNFTDICHELGHFCHQILGRLDFQLITGTRGSFEYSEIPSHYFECRANELIGRKRVFDYRGDIACSINDLCLHDPKKTKFIENSFHFRSTQQYKVMPQLGHYPANMYLYPYCKKIAQRIDAETAISFMRKGGCADSADLD